MENENKGPAEVIIQSLLSYTDHLYHNRPGMVVADGRTNIGLRWAPVTHKEENGEKVVYRLDKVGRRTNRVRVGVLHEDGSIKEGTRTVGHYRKAGIYPEVAKWMYSQVAEVWKLDNEFAARWASYQFKQEHRDLKVILAAFMLVQNRKGAPEMDGGTVAFFDDDYRAVGEAMMLQQAEKKDFNPKMLLRVREVLNLDEVAQINRDLGFGLSTRRPFLGRYNSAVEKWLRFRELNPRVLEGLVKAGFRKSVVRLAQLTGYKPQSPKFFEILRWKQKQSSEGHRQIAINVKLKKSDSWEELTERQICNRIVKNKPSWKVIASKVPTSVGITRAIMAAAIEANCLSDKDLIIATPTLEELGLLKVSEVKERWSTAVKKAEDQRARNIARNVRSQDTKDELQEAADTALQTQVEESTKGMHIYIAVDTSGSMAQSIEEAKTLLEQVVTAFPLEKVTVITFNTVAREVKLKAASSVGVRAAFRGVKAGGGTAHRQAVQLMDRLPPNDPDDDILVIWVGDEEETGTMTAAFNRCVNLKPMAFGFVRVCDPRFANSRIVQATAGSLGIPCFLIDKDTFSDPYSVPRTIRNLVASTPVNQEIATRSTRVARVSLVDTILQTELLQKPAWA
tara:strand:- start:49326 stop:51194 length:1869 start_codon:yes stop_codon:yes gene_type:complete